MNECITPYNLCFVCLILLEYISLPSPFVFSHPNAGLEVTSIPIVSHCHVSRFISHGPPTPIPRISFDLFCRLPPNHLYAEFLSAGKYEYAFDLILVSAILPCWLGNGCSRAR